MRTLITSLLAFAAGVLLMLWLGRVAVPATPAPTAQQAAARNAPDAPDTTDSQAADDGWPNDAPTPEQVAYAQPQLMARALAAVTPRQGSAPNLYLLAFAGDGSEGVFRNEAEYAARLFAQRFGARGHTLVLENNPGTLEQQPLASWSNLETALDGLAGKMDPSRDILLLYLTTHGSEDHQLLVDMDPLPLDQIAASDLGQILKDRPFKWKVVVVNACYSGGFIPPLRGVGTMVITAARADRSSFGCGSDADLTYFGKAWLVDALNRSTDFDAAFALARQDIAQWEAADHLTPSEPQLEIGSGIAAQLQAWRRSLAAGPPVPFKAAAPAAGSTH